MELDKAAFDQWAILELFGHTRIAGKISFVCPPGSCAFVRVDVPEVNGAPAFTRLFGSGAIYSITIVDETAALLAARECSPEPMSRWSVNHLLKALPAPADSAVDHSELKDLCDDDEAPNGPNSSF
jgi:hypothetical protein